MLLTIRRELCLIYLAAISILYYWDCGVSFQGLLDNKLQFFIPEHVVSVAAQN